MVFFAMSITRIITVYVAQGLLCVIFLFLAYRILKRDKKRLNVIFAGYYISAAIGLMINFIYAPIDPFQNNTNEVLVLFLNFLTNFGIFYSGIFIVVFDLILLKSEKVVTTGKQTILLLIHGIAMFGMILIASNEAWGVEFDPETWSPHWKLPFFLYVVIVETIIVLVPFLYLSLKVMTKFEDEVLRKKWKLFIGGFICSMIFMYGIFISNFLNIPAFRTGMGLTGLILAIIGSYLIYYGVGKQLEK